MIRAAVVVGCLALTACGTPRDLSTFEPLGDAEFWQVIGVLSEPPGTFDLSDNLVSNEIAFARLAARLGPRGGVYIGVGPEQNFSYIARLQSELAFILDIRPENLHLHLLYKALFEISRDRAEFVSHLFSRTVPGDIGRSTPVADLFAAIEGATVSPDLQARTRQAIRTRLLEVHRLPLSEDALRSMDEAFDAFGADGPAIRYNRARPPDPAWPAYRVLMSATDQRGDPRSFLASEDAFAYVKALHARNRIVPVVGDFAGSRAIRGIADDVRARGLQVTAFYASNVEVHMTRDQQRAFCASLATLPFDGQAFFIGSDMMEPMAAKLARCAAIPPSLRWP